MQNSNNVAEALLQHQTWVRRLAEVLVPDPAGADDVVQETWREVLERPPRGDVRHPRAWLASVVRSRVRNRARGEARRRRREEAAARPEAAPEELASRARIQRDLVDAILELGEETRDALLARFFDDLPPREIALRQGVSVATVKSRLRRGLERLRTRLDAEYGDRGRWSAVLLPLAKKSAPALAGWLTGAALVLVTAGAWAVLHTGGVDEVTPDLEFSPGADTLVDAPSGAQSPAEASLAAASAPTARVPVDEPHVLVVDAAGARVVGARVRYARVDAPDFGEGSTDEHGRVELPASGEFFLAATPAVGTGLAELRSVAAAGTTLRLPPQGALEVRFVDAAGRGVPGVEVRLLNGDPQSRLAVGPAGWSAFLESRLAGHSEMPAEDARAFWERQRRRRERGPGTSDLIRALQLAWPPLDPVRTSGPDGRVRWDGLPPSAAWEVQVVSAHLLPEPEELRGVEVRADGGTNVDFTALPPPNTSSPMHVHDGEESLVQLALLDAASVHGRLDPGATSWARPPRVVLQHDDGSNLGGLNGAEEREAQAADDGAFSFHALRPGEKILSCAWVDAEGRTQFVRERIEVRAGESLELGLLAAREGRDLRVRVRLVGPGGEVLDPGLVTRAGRRGLAPDAERPARVASLLRVTVHGEDGPQPFDDARSLAPWPGDDLRLTGLPVGTEVELHLRLLRFEVADGYRLADAGVVARLPFPEDGVVDLDFVLNELVTFQLSVGAATPDVEFPTNLRVQLDGPTTTSVRVPDETAVEVQVAPGRYRASARVFGGTVPGVWGERELDVRGGETYELLLAPAAGLRGTARPSSIVRLAYGEGAPDSRDASDVVAGLRTDADGEFELGGLAPNRSYVVRCGPLSAVVETGDAGTVREVELR